MERSERVEHRTRRTYTVLFLVEHEWGDGPTGIGAITGLTADMDSSTANAGVVDGAGDGMRRRRH